VAVNQQGQGGDARTVWNLRTGKRVGSISPVNGHQDFALSPDGTQMAGKLVFGQKPTVEIWSVADGRSLNKFEIDDKFVFLQPLDFAGPGRLLTAKGVELDTLLQVWDVTTGKALWQLRANVNPDIKMRAQSPGRKYLALPYRDNKKVLICDLTTGQMVGETIVPPIEFGSLQCKCLAFAPDGKTLTGIFTMGFDGYLVSWDMATGQMTANPKMEKDPQFQVQNGFGYQGLPLEWLPDGSSLLAYGQLLLEPKTGKVAWTLARDVNNNMSPRRVIGSRHLATITGDFQQKKLVLEALPRDKIDAAFAALRQGKDPAATQLPPATPADWSAVRTLPPPVGAVAWNARPDPAPAPKGKLGGQRIPLQARGGDVQSILMSSPDVGQTAVLTAAGDDGSTRKQVRAERYDLASGGHLGTTDLFSVELPSGRFLTLVADLSPDGARLVIKEPRDERRVDVWSLANRQHVVGWLPYEKEADPKVRWVSYIDTARVLTLGNCGKLVLWSVPECKALYVVSGLRDAVALSPGRRYLAAFNTVTYELLDTSTGERQGQLGGFAVQAVQTAGFRYDGQELAAEVRTEQTAFQLVRWDLATGKAAAGLPVAVGGTEITWFGPGLVMCNDSVYQAQSGWAITRLALPGHGKYASSSPDGRLWFAVSQFPNNPAALAAQTIPDDATRELMRQIADKTITALLAPGMSVSLQIDVRAPRNAEQIRQRITDHLSMKLRGSGIQVAAGADLRIHVQLGQERDTGKVLELESIGSIRGKQHFKIPIKEVDCQGSLSDGRGNVLWQQKQTQRTPDFFGILRTDDPMTHFTEALWNNCAGWATLPGLPPLLVRSPRGVEALPRVVSPKGDQ
jgi:WD40 repeat protein